MGSVLPFWGDRGVTHKVLRGTLVQVLELDDLQNPGVQLSHSKGELLTLNFQLQPPCRLPAAMLPPPLQTPALWNRKPQYTVFWKFPRS
ncbi:hypothetical protein STEG23_023715 [Scotinomys teguina]